MQQVNEVISLRDIDVQRVRLVAFVISGGVSALAGAATAIDAAALGCVGNR